MLKDEKGSSSVVEMTVILPVIFIFLAVMLTTALMIMQESAVSDLVKKAAVRASDCSGDYSFGMLEAQIEKMNIMPMTVSECTVRKHDGIIGTAVSAEVKIKIRAHKTVLAHYTAYSQGADMEDAVLNRQLTEEKAGAQNVS